MSFHRGMAVLAAGLLLFLSGCADDVPTRRKQFPIHSNGTVLISGGTLMLTARDDGIHADMELGITGGDIQISK